MEGGTFCATQLHPVLQLNCRHEGSQAAVYSCRENNSLQGLMLNTQAQQNSCLLPSWLEAPACGKCDTPL